MAQEFIIALTEHRAVGTILTGFMIEKSTSYYTVTKQVKLRDVKSGEVVLSESELALLKLIENYSDEMLVKKFSRDKDMSSFFQKLDSELFTKHISPYIEKHIYRCILLMMNGTTRLFSKQVKYANLYDEDEIAINRTFSESVFYFNRDQTGTKYKLNISHDGKKIDLLHKTIRMICTVPCCFVLRNRLYVFRQLSGKRITPFLTKDSVSIPLSVEEKYYQSFVLNTIKESEVVASGFEIEIISPSPQLVISLEQDLTLSPAIVVKFRYNNIYYLPDSPSNTLVSFEKRNNQYFFKKSFRNNRWEQEQLAFLKGLGLKFRSGFWNTEFNQKQSDEENYYRPVNWIAKHRETLETKGFFIVQNKLNKVYFTGSQKLDIQVKSQDDWFDLHAVVTFGSYQIPFIRLRRHIMSGIREFELPSGEMAILPEVWFTVYKDFFPISKTEGDHIRIRKHHYYLLEENLNLITEGLSQLSEKKVLVPFTREPVPVDLKAELRSYQKNGYYWMHHLYANRFGGCLADDMGLGKTVQTIALLLKIRRTKTEIQDFQTVNSSQLSLFGENRTGNNPPIQPASLIVMPTSLIHNWENEFRKFAPSLLIYKHIGSFRSRAGISAAIRNSDVILTTYGTLRNDAEMLQTFNFFYLILDESQNIKNSSSKTYKSLLEIQSKHRLVITGTPIENSLSDLWSQLNFLNRGLLGSLPYFKREFISPIEKKNDQEKELKLQKLIGPFVLRRTKEEVASDLPSLTEQIHYCEMSEKQREIYESEKSAIRNAILKNIESVGLKNSSLVVLQGLTKLRQLANHPSMVEQGAQVDSGKLNEIEECLENLLAEKHKVLIFSSFVKHLELLQSKIAAKNWKYSILTGKTVNRQEVIREFQEDTNNHIFLISLKAGGVGLNLTSADYVFIIDPWWNPAAEIQAISRAHRIGQDKKVFVYRFITEDSIEEKIQILKTKKAALADKFTGSNNPINLITENEVLSLFS